MSLYVKVFTSFFTCRKTIRLRTLIGDDALWVPIRIWAYAAENQPNGDFSEYSAEELAMLIGYTKDATRMLQALQQACFFDGMCIHDWEEYNSYHKTFSERAKAAALARWSKNEKTAPEGEKTGEDSTGEEGSNSSGMLEASGSARGSESQVIAYLQEKGFSASDGTFLWNTWESNGWMRGKQKIKDWKACARSWITGGWLPSQKLPYGQAREEPQEIWDSSPPEYTDPDAGKTFEEKMEERRKIVAERDGL